MKAKLVKYPFDKKKYRWDTWAQGKEFEYYWDESLPNNFETIEPYIEVEDFDGTLEQNQGVIYYGSWGSVDSDDTSYGEHYFWGGEIDPVEDHSAYVMTELPQEQVQFNDEGNAIIRLTDRDFAVSDTPPQDAPKNNAVDWGDCFYYWLDYTRDRNNKADVEIRFYRTEQDVLADGKTLDDVATFTNNFNWLESGVYYYMDMPPSD